MTADASAEEAVFVDANEVVAHNLALIRRRRAWSTTQVLERITVEAKAGGEEVAEETLARLRRLLEAEEGRFDAHDLYLLALGFDVPIAYFFLPPPMHVAQYLIDSGRHTVELYAALLGRVDQLEVLDERLDAVDAAPPGRTAPMLRELFGMTGGAGTWPEHYRVWRADRLHRMSRELGPDLRRLARFVHQLSEELVEVAREAALADVEARGTTLPPRPPRVPRPQGLLPSPE